MGGRGGSSVIPRARHTGVGQAATLAGAAQPQQPPTPPQNLTPGTDLQSNAQATATLQTIMNMTDDQLAQAVLDSRNVDMPNFLNDKPDQTQQFVYQVGLNGAPTVLDQKQFDQFLKDNNIPRSQIMARSVNANGPYTAQHIADMFRYSELNYIGGKHGGQVYGAGTYFDMNGGGNTGYGTGATIQAVYNPATARTIDSDTLQQKARNFAATHPKFAREVGPYRSGRNGNMSIYALAMGYNAISSRSNTCGYQNIIDRSAVVVLKG